MIRTTLLLLAAAQGLAAQSLQRRVDAASDGEMRFTYAARPGVYGNGTNVIRWDCDAGECRSQQVEGNLSGVRRDDWRTACDSGPVRVALEKRRGEVIDLRVYVGGRWAGGAATDLGTVSAAEAAHFLVALAAERRQLKRAVFAATLADSVVIWPDLLALARNRDAPADSRKQAVFWVGQAAADAATEGLDRIAADDDEDREVRKGAIFALSQRPHEEGVPALIRIARTSRDGEMRRTAIFWLGQSDDPRALALFEELLLKP